MRTIRTDDALAFAVVDAIHSGDVEALKRMLREHPDLATARLGADDTDMTRTLLPAATDWPGHFPNGAATVAALVEVGADVNARFSGPHTETPLHWARGEHPAPGGRGARVDGSSRAVLRRRPTPHP